MNAFDRLMIESYGDVYVEAAQRARAEASARLQALLQPVEPPTLPPTAPRIRVERCIKDYARGGKPIYGDHWLCIWGDNGGDWCEHLTWRHAMDCALIKARARALGLIGRW